MGNKSVKRQEKPTKNSEEECELPSDSNEPATSSSELPTTKTHEASSWGTYVAKYDYDSRTDNDLRFHKGELLSVMNTDEDDDWWFARSIEDGKEGYIPSNYVAEWKSLEAQQWYFSKMSVVSAVNQLMMDCNQCGSYLVLEHNETVKSWKYRLLVRDKDRIQTYDIEQFNDGNCSISEHTLIFESIQHLVAHHQQQAGGLCSRLLYPCIVANNMKPQTAGLSKQTNKEWDIDWRKQLQLRRKISFDQFAEVFEGVWNGTTRVTVKALKPINVEQFLLEVTISRKLRHPNLMQLYAICTKMEPMFIVTELMKDGNLLDYLRGEGRSVKLTQLIDMSAQIASGMAYLEEQCYVHKDLAARTVMVENMVCKVSDSVVVHAIDDDGFSATEGYTSRLKWTAPEAVLYNRYSTKSDVWSFGIVLYEIFTHGRIPYAGMSFRLEDVYERGRRMQKPVDCPDEIYDIMLECWKEEPSGRPTFTDLKCLLEDFFLSNDDFSIHSNSL